MSCASTAAPATVAALAGFRDLVWPREHGSWSLALEPLVLGLLVAPSAAGACLAAAVLAAFFARRPLRLAFSFSDSTGAATAPSASLARRAAARGALSLLALLAFGLVFGAQFLARAPALAWLPWLLPTAVAGAIFLYFDLQSGGREEVAEVAGATAFALVPAALVAIAGRDARSALAVALVIGGRSVPTVLAVRVCLRAQKTGVRRPAPALIAAALAVALAALLVRAQLAPRIALVLLLVLGLRAFGLLVWPRPALRARSVGLAEAVLGAFFVLCAGLMWSR